MEKKWKIPFFLVREYKIFILFSILSMHLKIYKGGIGMVLRGYRLQGTDLTGITQEIKKISMSVNKIRARTYAKLLGNEIAFLVDKIALNVYTRDPTVSIYECACSRTEEEIRVAQLQGLKTPYNLQVYGQVFTEADYTYFAISCMQNEFLKAFHRLEEYSVSESEYEDPNNSKTKLWKSLMEKTATPMTINFGNGIPQIAKDQIVYPTKKERCRTEARHQVCNRILNQVSFGKQIPPECLMKNIDQMMKILLQEESQKEIAAKEKELMNTLPELEGADFIFSVPSADVPAQS